MSDSPSTDAHTPQPAAPQVQPRVALAQPQSSVGAVVQLRSQLGQAQALGGVSAEPPSDSATGGAQELMNAAAQGTAQASDALPHLGRRSVSMM